MSARNDRQVYNFDMDALVRFLRTAFPTATALHVQSISGIPAGSVENWMRARAKPSGEHIGALVAAFGPAFVAAIFPSTRQWAAPIIERAKLAEIARELSAMAEAAE